MAVVHIAAHPCLGKTSEASSAYFYLGAGINWLNDFKELLNDKLPCSVTSLQASQSLKWRDRICISVGEMYQYAKNRGKIFCVVLIHFVPTLIHFVFVFSLFLSRKTKSQADISNKFSHCFLPIFPICLYLFFSFNSYFYFAWCKGELPIGRIGWMANCQSVGELTIGRIVQKANCQVVGELTRRRIVPRANWRLGEVTWNRLYYCFVE